MLSQSVINDVQYYDIICIGNYAAICADIINSTRTHKYKIAVLHLSKSVRVPSTCTQGTDIVNVTRKPKSVDIIRKKIQIIMALQKCLILDDGYRLMYKYLIHGQDQWYSSLKSHPFRQALQNKYSRVYSNLVPGMEYIKTQGTIVFIVPNKAGAFRQNYPFLKASASISNQNTQIIILLQGSQFYPECKQAQLLLRNQLKDNNISVYQQIVVTKIDYLRRVLFFNFQGQLMQTPYQSVYCFLGEEVPQLLLDSGISAHNVHQKLLHHNFFDNIYILGGDVLPTTFTMHALSIQMHHISQNIVQRLTSQEEQRKAVLTAYDGSTSFYLYLGNNEIARISHKYDGKGYQVQQVGCCWSRFHSFWQKWLIKQFLNFQNFGPPNYLWQPCLLGSQKWRDQGQNYCQKEQLIKLSQLNYKTGIN